MADAPAAGLSALRGDLAERGAAPARAAVTDGEADVARRHAPPGRIFVDVTTTLAWDRPPVGVVRTEHNLVAFLLAQPDVELAFCRMDRVRDEHVVVPRAAVLAQLAARRLEPVEALDGPVPVQAVPPVPIRKRVRRSLASAVRRSIERLPAWLRPEAALLAESGDHFVRSLYWLGRRAVHAAAGRGRPVPEPPPREEAVSAVAGPADVYVSVGLDWACNDFDALGRLKQASGVRVVLQCYDLIPVRFPHFISSDARDFYQRYFTGLARVADHVVAISQATLDDYRVFLRENGVAAPAMSVLHLGTELPALGGRGRGTPPHPDVATRPFVLCVGTIEARKNHELLYHVWDRLAAAHGDRTPLLVLVGMIGGGVDDLLARMRVNRRLARNVLVLDRVEDHALLWLYEHALFTVFPSFCEGLGLPVVESLALGTPCLASDTPAVAEAARGLVPTLDPLDFPAWYEHVERWAFDPDARRAAASRLRDYRAPSWHAYGTSTLALLRALAAPAAERARRGAR